MLVLAAVARDEDQLFVGVQEREARLHFRRDLIARQRVVADPVQRVDDGVSCNSDARGVDPLSAQIVSGALGWCEMEG